MARKDRNLENGDQNDKTTQQFLCCIHGRRFQKNVQMKKLLEHEMCSKKKALTPSTIPELVICRKIIRFSDV